MKQNLKKLFSILALVSLTALFSISCSNENSTGSGNSGGSSGIEDISALPDATAAELTSYEGTWTSSDFALTSGTDIGFQSDFAFNISGNTFTTAVGGITATLKKESDTVYKAIFTTTAEGITYSYFSIITFTSDSAATLELRYLMEGGQSQSSTYKGNFSKTTTTGS